MRAGDAALRREQRGGDDGQEHSPRLHLELAGLKVGRTSNNFVARSCWRSRDQAIMHTQTPTVTVLTAHPAPASPPESVFFFMHISKSGGATFADDLGKSKWLGATARIAAKSASTVQRAVASDH